MKINALHLLKGGATLTPPKFATDIQRSANFITAAALFAYHNLPTVTLELTDKWDGCKCVIILVWLVCCIG